MLRAGTYVTGIPAPPCSGTAMLLSVSAEPPNTSSDTCISRCAAARNDADTRRAAASSDAMPLAVVERQRMALVAARARNRERRRGIEAAREQDDGAAHRQRPGTLPQSTLCSCTCKRTGKRSSRIQSASVPAGSSLVARREEHGARQRMLRDDVARPFVVGAVADDDLHGVVRRQKLEILPAIAMRLLRARRLEVDDARDARIDVRDVDRTARLERNVEARVAELCSNAVQRGCASGSPPVTQTYGVP